MRLLALDECESTGRKDHATDEWIKKMGMENMKQIFDPICPKPDCCVPSELVCAQMICTDNSEASASCDPKTCKWSFNCVASSSAPSSASHSAYVYGNPTSTISVSGNSVSGTSSTHTSSVYVYAMEEDSAETNSSTNKILLSAGVGIGILIGVAILAAIIMKLSDADN